MKKTTLFRLGGKGGDGKSLVMAHLAQKLVQSAIPFNAYDFEPGTGTFIIEATHKRRNGQAISKAASRGSRH